MMKKLYVVTLTGLMVAGLSAQSLQKGNLSVNGVSNVSNSRIKVLPMSEERALGDTLLYAPFFDIYVNPTDQAGFNLSNDDIDGLTANNGGNWTGSFAFWFTIGDAADLTPFDMASSWNDSANFTGATSWFAPPGQADNWLSMGPITVPATGATLKWRVKTNPQFKDGYRVLVNGTGLDPTADFGTEVIYSRADVAPNTTDNIDTVWTYYQANIPMSYNGNQVYFGFNHTADDMDVLWLDEILMVESATAGVDNNQFEGFGLNNVMPNPATDFAYINYNLGSNAEVSFVVTDINGKVVANINQGTKDSGTYNYALGVSEFNSGVYFVTLKAGQFSSTKKLLVTK
jgi:hypothetical protein